VHNNDLQRFYHIKLQRVGLKNASGRGFTFQL